MTSLVIDIRPARAADAEGLAEVHAAAWVEAYSGIIPALTLRRMVARRGAHWWRWAVGRRSILVLEVGGTIAGYATFAPARLHGAVPTAEIQELYLAPAYQGVGLGGRLFAAALKAMRGKGYRRVLVRALADNDRANGFYERRGGVLCGRSDETLGDTRIPTVWYRFRA